MSVPLILVKNAEMMQIARGGGIILIELLWPILQFQTSTKVVLFEFK